MISSYPPASPGVLLDGLRAGPDVRPAEAAAGPERASSSSAPGGLEEFRDFLLGVAKDLHEVGRDLLVEVRLTATAISGLYTLQTLD